MTEDIKNQILSLIDGACDTLPIKSEDRDNLVRAFNLIKGIRSEEEIDHIASTMDCSDYPQ